MHRQDARTEYLVLPEQPGAAPKYPHARFIEVLASVTCAIRRSITGSIKVI
jgi:hypothetical protein